MMYVNLLPWREAQRSERKRQFNQLLILCSLSGLVILMIVSAVNVGRLAAQRDLIDVLRTENNLLDKRIHAVNSLRQDIELLKARRMAVEQLQTRRTEPVHWLDELTARVPVGLALKSLRQTDVILLSGVAQSNARVSEFLRNLETGSVWLGKPELMEIKAALLGQGREAKKIVEFTIRLLPPVVPSALGAPSAPGVKAEKP